MHGHNKNNHKNSHAEPHKTAATPGLPVEDEAQEAAVPAEAGLEDLKAELDKARKEAAELSDKYLRLHAETDNFKKRMNREYSEREKYCNEGIIKELLPVLDNLDRALKHAEAPVQEAEAGAATGGNGGLVEGVKMVKKQLMDAFIKSGVTEVTSVGLPFDPTRQQAIMQVETGDYEPGTVVEELQKGYFLNDRILRPAMVTVAKRPGEKPAE